MIIFVITIIGFSFTSCNLLDDDEVGDDISHFNYMDAANVGSIGTFAITGYKGSGGSVTIPSRINGKLVTHISYDAFRDCTNINNITIPNSVTEILSQAFLGCSNMTSINMGNNITRIGNLAFGYCSSLTNITIPSKVNYIDEYIFYECTNLTSVEILSSSITFGGRGFIGLSSVACDLKEKYREGGIGTYTRSNGTSYTWSKQ